MVFLLATRAPLPQRRDWLPLAITAGGVVFGFPLFTSIAMRYVEAVHASVIVGVLLLATPGVDAYAKACPSTVRRTRRTLKALAISTPCISARPSSTPRYWPWSIITPKISGETACPMSRPA